MRADEPMSTSEELYRKYNPMQAKKINLKLDEVGSELVATIIQQERERIIEVIVERLETFDCDICGKCATQKELIALIKGENK